MPPKLGRRCEKKNFILFKILSKKTLCKKGFLTSLVFPPMLGVTAVS